MLIAWNGTRWLGATERADLIATYSEYLAMLDAEYPDMDAMPTEVMADYIERATELERLRRIHRCEADQLEFAIEYFSDARNPENDGNWDGFDIADRSESPAFHRELTDIMNEVSTVKTNAKIAAAAPRSHAKSTYLSKGFPVHEVVYRKRKYVIIISETPSVSKANMEWIRNQLKFNEKLRQDFGPLLSPKDQANIQDNSESFIAWHREGDRRRQIALVEAASTGQALRGRNWNGSRPDLIICDDLEDARPGGNASTQEQRNKLRDWFSQTVMPLGDPKGKRTAFVVMGTTVHVSSLLMHILHERSDFESKIYRAIIDEPVNAELWEQCRAIYIERENLDRKEDALKFYKDNEGDLLEGSKVLWPDVQPLLKLMMWKWDNGSKAFNTEYMNNPIDEESMIYNPDTFTYYNVIDTTSDSFFISIGVDFAFGRQNGDFSAIAVIARHKETGIIYVVDSFVERLPVDKFFGVIVDRVLDWQPDIVAADANAAQEFMAAKLGEALQAEGYPAATRLKQIKNRTKKELRIEAMKPDIENGTIRFHRKFSRLLEQFERYDGRGGFFDDAIDSLNMAVMAAAKSARRKGGNVGSYRY
jgi:predicted phage terminase large subunit-like protein